MKENSFVYRFRGGPEADQFTEFLGDERNQFFATLNTIDRQDEFCQSAQNILEDIYYEQFLYTQHAEAPENNDQPLFQKEILSNPYCRKVARKSLNLNIDYQTERRYSLVEKGNSEQTKSLHKNVKVTLLNFLNAQNKHQHFTHQEYQKVMDYSTCRESFESVLKLMGFQIDKNGSITENTGHEKIKEMCLSYLSSNEFCKASMSSRSLFAQKITRIKYINVMHEMVMEAPRIRKWKE